MTELIPEECISECVAEEITDFLVRRRIRDSLPKEFGGRKLESTTKGGSDLDEDEKKTSSKS